MQLRTNRRACTKSK
jgi:hypothetical protein